jgi:uncharacterized protein YjbJ (UPF0337 family)
VVKRSRADGRMAASSASPDLSGSQSGFFILTRPISGGTNIPLLTFNRLHSELLPSECDLTWITTAPDIGRGIFFAVVVDLMRGQRLMTERAFRRSVFPMQERSTIVQREEIMKKQISVLVLSTALAVGMAASAQAAGAGGAGGGAAGGSSGAGGNAAGSTSGGGMGQGNMGSGTGSGTSGTGSQGTGTQGTGGQQ